MQNDIHQLTKQVKEWLDHPLKLGIAGALKQSVALLSIMKKALHENPDTGKDLGSLIGKVKGWQNRLEGLRISNPLTGFVLEIVRCSQNGSGIYVHCSAGIHRTGMTSYAFLRYMGLSSTEAKTKLNELRPTTREGVGDNRLTWGEQFGSD